MQSATRIKLWMNLIAVVGFAAGIAVGTSLAWAYALGDPGEDPLVQELRDEYDLRPDQVTQLRRILTSLEAEIRLVYLQYRELVPGMQQKLSGARRRADERIEEVLDEVQREKYRKTLAARDDGLPEP